VKFLFTPEAQRGYAKYGLRPVDPAVASEVVAEYPAVEDLWKIEFLGGWEKVITDIYGPQGIYSKMYEELHSSK
jgi:sulfate/thiosulfate transport system substrate-binding protein